MEKSDLRIGNFVSLKGDIEELQLGFHAKDYKPLRINEEWLNELGFKNGILKTGRNVYTLKLIKGRKTLFQFSKNKSSKKIIKYVHELQNIYFETTNKELEIKYDNRSDSGIATSTFEDAFDEV
jgi:hypothetical protein